jgi:predicted DNA-binding protein (MmcQ/YjbR family)
MRDSLKTVELGLRDHGLRLPGTHEDFPWGHRALKVKGKVFAFLCLENGTLSMSVKLPISGTSALDRPFAEPTGYGLGKKGWVSSLFEAGDRPPVELLRAWIDESYRAIAPKSMLAELDGSASPARERRGPRTRVPAKPRKQARKR